MRKSLFILGTIFALASCKKQEKLPEQVTGDPVFYLEASMQGQPLQFQAGNEKYYMHASHAQNKENLYIFRGDLAQNCITDCGYALTVLINDHKISLPGAPVVIDSAIHTGFYQLYSQTFWPAEQKVNFVPDAARSGIAVYSWKIDDEKETVRSSSDYSLSTSLTIGKTYTVTFSFDDGVGGCQSTHKNIFTVGNPFQTQIFATPEGALSYKFDAGADEPGDYTYAWDFGDSTMATGKSVKHIFNAEGSFRVKLTVKDQDNKSCVNFYQLSASNNKPCEANFSATFLPLDLNRVLRSITILLKDPSGKVYSSADAVQPESSFAKIVSVSGYRPNQKGEDTRSIDLRFDCVLKSGNEEISLHSAKAAIAVSYK